MARSKLTARRLWRNATRRALRGFEHWRGGRSAAAGRRASWLYAAGWFSWITAPAVASGRAPFGLLVAVTATGTLAMHILIPVLPLAAVDLGVSRGAIQQAITLYLFGIAGGQLLYGPISDRFGRRPTLIVSLALSRPASSPAWLRRSGRC